MGFDEIVGQHRVKDFLQKSLEKNRTAHGYLFTGPEAVGKRKTALIFAQGLNCTNESGLKPCGVCVNCRKIKKGLHPDVKVIQPQGSSLKIDQVREIQKDITIKPFEGRKKVYIIDQGEKMTVEAGNCLLKVFEEPPVYAVIIILTVNESLILPTLVSRAQKLTFDPVSIEDIEKYLSQRVDKPPHLIKLYAAFSEGSIGRALEIAQSDEFAELREEIIKLILKLGKCSSKDVFTISDRLQNSGFDMDKLIEFFIYWYRDILILKARNDSRGIVNNDMKQELFDESRILDYHSLLIILEKLQATKNAVNSQANKSLALDVVLMEIKGVYENVYSSRSKIQESR